MTVTKLHARIFTRYHVECIVLLCCYVSVAACAQTKDTRYFDKAFTRALSFILGRRACFRCPAGNKHVCKSMTCWIRLQCAKRQQFGTMQRDIAILTYLAPPPNRSALGMNTAPSSVLLFALSTTPEFRSLTDSLFISTA